LSRVNIGQVLVVRPRRELVRKTKISYGLERLLPIIKKISVSAGFIIAGMIFHTAWGTALPLKLAGWDWFGVAVVFLLIDWRNIPAVWVVLGSAAIGLMLSWLT
jgi:chromate transporter